MRVGSESISYFAVASSLMETFAMVETDEVIVPSFVFSAGEREAQLFSWLNHKLSTSVEKEHL